MGIILLPLGTLVIGLYIWAVAKGTRWAYRKFARQGAIVAIVIFALLPIGDTIVNRWYHKNALCTRDEVGLRIYERVKLPQRYYDSQGRFKAPDGWFSGRVLVNGRYQKRSGYMEGGVFPFTAYEKRFSGVFDIEKNRFISYEVDYWTKGGGWWLTVFRPAFPREDYLTYVRGIVNGVDCSVVMRSSDRRDASVNSAFEGES